MRKSNLHNDLTSFMCFADAYSETVDSGFERAEHTVTYVTITTTQVEEQKGTDVRKAGESVTAKDSEVQLTKGVSTTPSRTSGQQRYEVQSSVQGGAQRKPSFYQETHLPVVTDARQSPNIYSASKAVVSRRSTVLSESMHNSALERLLQVQRLHREEKEIILDFVTVDYEDYKRACEEQFEVLRTENERLLQELSASTSQITLLQIQLSPLADSHPGLGTASQHDKVDSTITTTITTITTTITTVTTRIEQWKHMVAGNKGQITISNKELDQLLLDLSTASSQMTVLQQNYAGLSRDFSSVCRELQVTLSLCDEKNRTIAMLTAEVAQWRNADGANAQQIAAVRRENEMLWRDLSAASSRTAEPQQRHGAQPKEFGSAPKELHSKASLIEERDLTIASFTAEVAQWRQSDVTKGEQIATGLQDSQKLQRDLSTYSPQMAELQKRYDAQSKELGSVRNELQANKSLVEEKDRTIATLTAIVDQWKRPDATNAAKPAAERRDKENPERDLAAFAPHTANLQQLYDAQSKDIVTIRNELKTKASLLEEKQHTITSLTIELAEVRHEGSAKAEQIANARRDIERLQSELSSASDRFTEFQERHVEQSQELDSVRDEFDQLRMLYFSRSSGKQANGAVAEQIKRALEEKNQQMEELRREIAGATLRNTELQGSYEARLREISTARDQLSVQSLRHKGTITSLTSQVEQWKRADGMKAEQIASTLEQVENLRQDLSTSTSHLVELQSLYETQLSEFIAVRNERISSSKDKDRTVAAQVEDWKGTDALKEGRIVATRKQTEDLQRELTSISSQIAELRQRYEVQSRELRSPQDQLQDKVSGKDRSIPSLLFQVEERKRSDTAKGDELTTVREDLAQLHRYLATSSFQIEGWKRSHATKTAELTVAQKDIEQLRRDLSTSSSQIIEYQQRYAARLVELTSQIKQWKCSDVAKAEELATAGKKIEQLQRDLFTSSSRITQFQQCYEAKSAEFGSAREQLQAYEEQLRVLKSALAERQPQLDAVQRFVITADKYADTMIIQMLQRLNAEVQQYTEFMADRVLRDFGPRATKLTKEQSSAALRVSEFIGKTLTDCLGGEKRNDVALHLPIAFQAYLTYYLHSVIASWTIKKDRDQFINEIYERLQESGKKLNFECHQLFCSQWLTEAQMISGRWRSLTRTYISPTCISDPDALISVIVEGLSDIIVAAGCVASLSTARSKVSSQFRDKVTSIISIAGQFNKMIGEVVSADFEVLVVRPVQMFEETTMEDDIDNQEVPSGTATGQKVLCSTQLGLTKRVQMESGYKDRFMVMKAKVILESFVEPA